MAESPKVLLVDDEPETLRLVRKVLQADGCEVLEATDGLQALDLFRNEKPDLVLLDIVMPRLDGLAVLRAIREEDQATAVIMASALSSEKLTLEAMLAGADDYVSKPFPLKEMRVRIRQALEKTRLRRDNIRLQKEVNALNAKVRELLERYMPPSVVQRLINEPGLPELGGERQIITVLFADIRGFTRLAEKMTPNQLVEMLNFYLALTADAIMKYEGTLDKFMGDGAMGVYNAPLPQPDHALRAVKSALALQKRLSREQAKKGDNLLPLKIGIGIHTGEAIVGNIGTPYLMNYTAVGDAVNLARRLQELAQGGQILISEAVYALVQKEVMAEKLGPVTVKGKSQPVDVYNVLSLRKT